MDKYINGVHKILDYIAAYVAAVPTQSWVALGSLLGGSSLVVGIVAWMNRRSLRKHGEKLGRMITNFNVVFWSAMATVLSFILTTGNDFAAFLPFLGTHWPQVIGIATVLYNISKPSLAWWKARKEGKALTDPLPAVVPETPVVETPKQPVPSIQPINPDVWS